MTEFTAVIPTFQRQDLLARAIQALIESANPPTEILVSEGSHDLRQRATTAATICSFGCRSRTGAPIARLIAEPIDGRMCSNRNHLIEHVRAPHLLLIDDDCSVHPEFSKVASALLDSGYVHMVTAMPTILWYDFRGFWRHAHFGEGPAISLKCVMGSTVLFQDHLLDERIAYGSEDADFAFRLGRSVSPPCVVAVPLLPEDGGIDNISRYGKHERRVLQVRSRVLVGVRRYWESPVRLAIFLGLEFGAWLAGRQSHFHALAFGVSGHQC